MDTFARLESEVRSYCRSWPTVFTEARGSWLTDETGTRYLDLFAGAGALNYGHNDPDIKAALLDYLADDNVVHGLDMTTDAKRDFLDGVRTRSSSSRAGWTTACMFPGPTGTNAVEAALKLARKVTGRTNVICFTNAFHGMTLGALAGHGRLDEARRCAASRCRTPTGCRSTTTSARGSTPSATSRPTSTTPAPASRLPAAVIVETVQGEGGLRVASDAWLQRLAEPCATSTASC